ncbi:hypothetical protein [Candidatus Cardinium sp. TP]|uniref:hypothetical protein n=1 Tax=Candidatus Cardinium sp. TP TaxID=2961955 RepID=UPI0021AFA69F|nr:hypothetical protein [Candidatus Cardinium sp. TP]MCT4697016.1 hypothetical protein [Candidatus Cardinium sp. TP]MDN5246928.1 hypothetical protein [Candidatus Cardinium sp.]
MSSFFMHLFHYLGLWFLFSFCPLFAYSSDRPLSVWPNSPSVKWLCTIRGQSFIDNTEYFNKIIEGTTIFGFNFLPNLTLVMAQDISLNLGFIWEKHFGHVQPWHGIRPTLSIYYHHPPTTCIVGIFSPQTTPLLEPLYLQRKPFIEGLHFRLAKNKNYLSGWLDWRTLLSKKENKPESFTLHLEGACCQGDSSRTVTLPFHLAVYHLGGQGIQVKDYSLWCGATGFALRFSNCLGGSIYGASYLLFSRYIKAIDRPFKEGWGQWHTIDWQMPWLGISLSYWYGHNFSSENMGHPLYQSIRIEDRRAVYYERIRSLLFLSIYKHWRHRSGVTIQAVVRPYYDWKNRLLEYGFSSTLTYAHAITLQEANNIK